MFASEQTVSEWKLLLKNVLKAFEEHEGVILPPYVNRDISSPILHIPNVDFVFDDLPWLNLALANHQTLSEDLQNGISGIICRDKDLLTSIDTQIVPVYLFIESGFELHYKDDFFNISNYHKARINILTYKDKGINIVHELAIAQKMMYDLIISEPADNFFLLLEVGVGTSFLEEIAKIRSLRYLAKSLGRILNKNIKVQIFATNTVNNKVAADDENNIIRATIETMAAVLGGSDGIYYNTTDGHIRKLAQNIQHLLVHESDFGKNRNTVEGAYAVELLTKECVEKSWQTFLSIREKNSAEVKDVFNAWCEGDAYELQRKYDTLEKIWVGVNKFQFVRK